MNKPMLKQVLTLAIASLLASPVYAQAKAKEGGAPSKTSADLQTMSNQFWWPERLDLAPLRQHAAASSPMDSKFNYSQEFKKLDIKAVKSEWPGTAPAPTVSGTGVAAPGAVSSASSL
jgi:catalase-peroxidase